MELSFPFKGLNKGILPSEQPKLSTSDLKNVRPYFGGRARGGQRPAMKKKYSQQIGGAAAPIVAIVSVTVVE